MKKIVTIMMVLAILLGVQTGYANNNIVTIKPQTIVASEGIDPAKTDIADEEETTIQTMPNPYMDFEAWRNWYASSRTESYEDANVYAKKLANRTIQFERKAAWSCQEFVADVNVDVPYAFDVQTSVATSKATYTIGNEYLDIVRWHLGGCREYNVGDYSSNWKVNRIVAVNDVSSEELVYYTVLGGKDELYYSSLTSPDNENYNVEVPNFVDPVCVKGINPKNIANVFTAFDTVQNRYSLIFEMSTGDILEVYEDRVVSVAKNCQGIILSEECLVVKVGDSGSARYFDYLTKVKKQ